METAEFLEESLDRLERLAAAKDLEIQRLRAELARKDIFLRELRSILQDHKGRFETWERRLRRLEAGLITSPPPSSSSESGTDTCPP